MKWVTFYWSIMGGVCDVTVHKDRDTATRFFRAVYKSYFEINIPFDVKLPCRYGFAHRAFYGMTKTAFEKKWGKIKGGAA